MPKRTSYHSNRALSILSLSLEVTVVHQHASVHLLYGRATATATATTTATAGHAPRHVWHATFAASCSLVYLHHDWVHDTFELLLLSFEFFLLGQLVLIQPVQGV